MASFTVRVVDQEQNALENREVTLGFTSFFRGMTDSILTDEDGRAEFDNYEEGEVKVFVDGHNYGEYDYEDGAEITITKDW